MKNIYKALAEFQQECPIIHKGTEGYGYSYASYDSIVKEINPIMKKHNLGFTQLIDKDENNRNHIKTILFHHESGEVLESTIAIPQGVSLKGMNQYQVDGSSFTYYKRYGLSSMLGIITDKDIDAAGSQVPSNGIKDSRVDEFAQGKELHVQLKKVIVAMAKHIGNDLTIEELEYESEQSLRNIFDDYKGMEIEHNAKTWVHDQMSKPRKTGSISALEKTWKEAVQRGFGTKYVIEQFKKKKQELGVVE